MKVKREDVKESFVPFDLVITIESEEEARAMYAIFNKTANDDLLGGSYGDYIKDLLGDKYYVDGLDEIIANDITYGQFYLGDD